MNNKSQETKEYLINLQKDIVSEIEKIDGLKKFRKDEWQKAENEPLQGAGITQIMEGGKVFERAGIGFSHVSGASLPKSATQNRKNLTGAPFEAMGVSLVFHPVNPFVPTVHMNVRTIIAGSGENSAQWFGGGMDLTPYYGFEEDCKHFHNECKKSLENFGEDKYPAYKKWCDEYFYNHHRKEARGIGGIFFDDYSENDGFELIKSVGNTFLKAYTPIVNKRKDVQYNTAHREHQLYRRGRYVEFNLVWDRGTHFGLQSGGRAESILLSMPPLVSWKYQNTPQENTPEYDLVNKYLIPQKWI